MRFGKRLAEVVQHGNAAQPYVTYKELKRMVNEMTLTAGGTVSDEDIEALSTGPEKQESLGARQRKFFDRLDSDIAASKSYVLSAVVSLEVSMGEMQVLAVSAGLLFTPKQLSTASNVLPCPVKDQSLMRWLQTLTPFTAAKQERHQLVDKYTALDCSLNDLLKYIEVNLMAVRKILKKFEKKITAELRTLHAHEYLAHQQLLTPSLLSILVAAAHMHRLIDKESALPSIEIGPETLSHLTRVAGSGGPAMDSVFGPLGGIDVYAKPNNEGETKKSVYSPRTATQVAARGFPTSESAVQTGPTTQSARSESSQAHVGRGSPGKGRRKGGHAHEKGRGQAWRGPVQNDVLGVSGGSGNPSGCWMWGPNVMSPYVMPPQTYGRSRRGRGRGRGKGERGGWNEQVLTDFSVPFPEVPVSCMAPMWLWSGASHS
mmetsp:Transcript_55795/g.148785  ORF Transcript_55795/g.148785 Transcript_55795/m.148785 type:complete len:430 (-) Transcript_55795:185-1474(-)